LEKNKDHRGYGSIGKIKKEEETDCCGMPSENRTTQPSCL